jgi:hypothetical protein
MNSSGASSASMLRKKICSLLLLAILFSMLIFVETVRASSSLPNIYVSPSNQAVKIGGHFALNVNLDNVSDLYGYEVWLSFDSSKVNATAVVYDGYLNPPTYQWANTINNTGGYVDFAISSTQPALPRSGGSPPPLVTINFTTIGLGTSPLHLDVAKTILVSSLHGGTPIPYNTTDGTITVVPLSLHDVAAISVHPYHFFLGKGYSMDVNVTVRNKGDFTENFDVLLCINLVSYARQTVTLSWGSSATITFRWATTDYARGNYTISAYAWPVPGETNLTDNFFLGYSVLITKVGDLGSRVGSTNTFGAFDGAVTSTDLNLFLQCYKGTAPAQWMYLADLGSRVGSINMFFVCDDAVTSTDLNLFLQCYKGYGP